MAIGPIKKGAYHKQKGIAADKTISKATEEKDTHSSNKLTRKRAQFALNARKWHHKGQHKGHSRSSSRR